MMLCDALVTRESISISLFSLLAQTDFQSSLCNLCMHPLCCHHNVECSFQLEVKVRPCPLAGTVVAIVDA